MKEKDITFEDKLWKAADKLRKKVEVHEYKYVVLGLIFLRYLSYAFEEKRKEVLNREAKSYPEEFKMQVAEDRDIYLANGTLYVPEKASWDYIKKNANQQNIGEILDEAIGALEDEHPKQLKLHFDSKTSILAISEKQNAVKMGINEKRDFRFVKM